MSIQNNDLHSNVTIARGVGPVAIGTTGTGQVGAIIDRQGYGGVEFLISYGTVTATAAVYTVTLKEGDATGSMTSVADSDMIGTEALAGVGAGTRVDGTNRLVTKKLGYKGNKRYVQCGVKSTATAGTLVSVNAVLFNPAVG
ncbi:MAG: hypothetical protein RL756_1730 [Pseudomonadota bacterium]|jgi:hypothetical protein